jgi:hypothetical protein
VEGGELAAEVRPGRGIKGTQIEPFKSEPACTIPDAAFAEDPWHADVGSEQNKAAGLGSKQRGFVAARGFDENPSAIGEIQTPCSVNAAAAKRLRSIRKRAEGGGDGTIESIHEPLI